MIMGAHEHLGASSPTRLLIQDFQDCIDTNDLLHLNTIKVYYMWSNGRMGNANTSRRLDRAICNMDWFSTFNQTSCCSLTKVRSDHFPLLLNFNNSISFNACKTNVDCSPFLFRCCKILLDFKIFRLPYVCVF